MRKKLVYDDHYYENEKYLDRGNVKRNDFGITVPAITYAEGCKRRLAVEDGHCVIERYPGFGLFIAKPENEEEACLNIERYIRVLATHLIGCVYQEGVLPEKICTINIDQALRAYYMLMPSVSYFMTSDMGETPYEKDPYSLIRQDGMMNDFRSPDREVRKRYFG